MFTLNQPFILSKTQKYDINRVTQYKARDNEGNQVWNVDVEFIIRGDDNEEIGRKTLHYDKAEYNDFWENYNSGAFIYQELIDDLQVQEQVPADVEDYFINEEPQFMVASIEPGKK